MPDLVLLFQQSEDDFGLVQMREPFQVIFHERRARDAKDCCIAGPTAGLPQEFHFNMDQFLESPQVSGLIFRGKEPFDGFWMPMAPSRLKSLAGVFVQGAGG
jgi:hypothetical protein